LRVSSWPRRRINWCTSTIHQACSSAQDTFGPPCAQHEMVEIELSAGTRCSCPDAARRATPRSYGGRGSLVPPPRRCSPPPNAKSESVRVSPTQPPRRAAALRWARFAEAGHTVGARKRNREIHASQRRRCRLSAGSGLRLRRNRGVEISVEIQVSHASPPRAPPRRADSESCSSLSPGSPLIPIKYVSTGHQKYNRGFHILPLKTPTSFYS
jgi:hypothetical protein